MPVTNLLLAAKALVGPDPIYADGYIGQLTMNQDGRLRVSTKPGFFDMVTGSLTAVGNTIACDVTDASNVMLHIKNTGTVSMTAGVLQFEGSLDSTNGTDGTWFPIQGVRSNANTIETATPTLTGMAAGAGYANAWELSVNACRWFRVRCSTAVTTNAIAFVTVIRGTYATEPVPAIQAHGISGTVTVASGSGTTYNLVTAATTNLAVVKATAGSLAELTISNITAATIYVKLYNKTTAPVVASDVPVMTIPVLAGTFVAYEFGLTGKRFASGIGIAVTGAAIATDATAVAVGAQINATHTA